MQEGSEIENVPVEPQEQIPKIPNQRRRLGVFATAAAAVAIALGGLGINKGQTASPEPSPTPVPTIPEATPSPTKELGKVPWDLEKEKKYRENMKSPDISEQNENYLNLRNKLIESADPETGFIKMDENVRKKAAISYDAISDQFSGQILSPDALVFTYPDGQRQLMFKAQIEAENWLMSIGFTPQDTCNLMSWNYDPQSLAFSSFEPAPNASFASEALSCTINIKSMQALPKTK